LVGVSSERDIAEYEKIENKKSLMKIRDIKLIVAEFDSVVNVKQLKTKSWRKVIEDVYVMLRSFS
jgi:hypothetical protein